MLLLEDTAVIQRLEDQKLFENYLGEQECSEELTWVGKKVEKAGYPYRFKGYIIKMKLRAF